MSNYQRKQRLSTITTQAHSNGPRLKTTGPQFNTLNRNIQHLAYIVNKNSIEQPYRPVFSNNKDSFSSNPQPRYNNIQHTTNNGPRRSKQRRRYSEAAQSRNSSNSHKKQLIKSLKTEVQPSKQYRSIQLKKTFQHNNKYKHNISHHTMEAHASKKQQQEYVNSDEYIQQMQRQKNKRIQEIYNPQSMASSKINSHMYFNVNGNYNNNNNNYNNNGQSISVLRNKNKIKNRVISINKIKTEQLLQLLNKDNKNNKQPRYSRQKSHHEVEQTRSTSHKGKSLSYLQISKQNNVKQKYVEDNHYTQNSSNSNSKILPVTFQRIQQLSTIKQTIQSGLQANKYRNKNINVVKKLIQKQKQTQRNGQLSNERNTKLKRKPEQQIISEQDNANNYTQINLSQNSQKPNSEVNLPFPKFNNYFDSYSSEKNKRENKTYLFEQLKNSNRPHYNNKNKTTVIESPLISYNESSPNNSSVKQDKWKQLTIFNQVDKSLLKVIKDNENVFYGQVNQEGLKNGKGAIFYHNGKVYEGQFKNNEKQGYGVETYIDGSVYSGQFKNGKRNGKGRFQWPNGQVYDGQWLNNVKHGSGLWQSKDSVASYIGQWSYGTISGFGVLTNEKGQRYEGQFQNFNKQGHGAYRFENGDRIVGSFKNNRPNGQCQYFWANGDYYKGQFSNGLRHGRGIIKYEDGSYFEGQFRNDKKCGLGQQNYNDGITYYGNYENDLRHGFGKLIYEQILYYEGYWINNVAVIFQEQFSYPNNEIIEEQKERLASGLSNNFSSKKLKKLGPEQQEKILKSMRSRAQLIKSKIQRFSSKNLLQRLCQPKKRCKCLLKH